ncbi:hypothetical protein [Parapedobacter sp.]|uniref:hypothetical protein n=1 Tax=Parapedobacter sp. TaxID=1958893 RepID=UPI002D801053|nr:hypothetical protein [Parapedobacter sp.]
MINKITGQTNIYKYSRVIKRDITSFASIDKQIKEHLEAIEERDSNVWSNPSYNKNEFVHSIFQYPAMMVPEVQRQIIDVIFRYTGSQQINAMLDPFMGSATSLVSSMHYGIDCYGQDINPLAILIAKVRTSLINVNFKKLRTNVKHLFSLIEQDKDEAIECEYYNIDKWFKNTTQLELSRIVRAIRQEEDILIRQFYWANLAEVIRVCSNDRTSTYKLHARPIHDIQTRVMSAVSEFRKQLEISIDGYAEFKEFLRKKGRINGHGYLGNIYIKQGDSKKDITFEGQPQQFANLLVSSPPYGDNHTTVTYGQYSFLQLQWIDLEDIYSGCSDAFLKSTAEIDRISIGGKRKLQDFSNRLGHLLNLSASFRQDYLVFRKQDPVKKEKIVSFLYDLDMVLTNAVNSLAANSYMVWTMGNRSVGQQTVNNVQYLKEMLESKGCIFVHSLARTIHNKRMAKNNGLSPLMNTEEILIFRKPQIDRI